MSNYSEFTTVGQLANPGHYLHTKLRSDKPEVPLIPRELTERSAKFNRALCNSSRIFPIILLLILTSIFHTSMARPPSGTSSPSENPHLVEIATRNGSPFGNETRSTGSNKERTRILTFPRRSSSTHSNRHQDRDDDDDDSQDIVFPDSLDHYIGGGGGGGVQFEPAMTRLDAKPDCASKDGGTFCEDIPSYPYKLLRDILGRSKSANSVLFGADDDEPDEIAQRIGDPEENFICAAVPRTIYPKVGMTKNRKWKYIINQGTVDGYVQGVRVETCISMGKPCQLFGNLPNGYVTSCKQKYIYRKMLALSEGGQPIPDTFLMPSACCCSYKRDARFLGEFFARPVTPIQ